jgi:hypothetical protein
VQLGEIERLGDDPLGGERGIAVDQDRHGDAGVDEAGLHAAIGLLGAGDSLDDRIDCLEMAGVGGERHLDLPRPRGPDPVGTEVVLDVPGPALRACDDRLDRALAFELPQHCLVRGPERVHEDAQPASVRHPEHGAVRAIFGGQLDCFVEHGDEHVEPFDRELLLTQERTLEVALEHLDLGEPLEQAALLLGGKRAPVSTRLDRLAQPDALLVLRDVLDLVGHRPAVRLPQLRESVGERLARHGEPQQPGGDASLQLGRERRHEPIGLQRGIADGLRSERIQPRREMPVRAVRLDQCGRRRDAAEQLLVGDLRCSSLDDRLGCGCATVAVGERLEQAEEARVGSDDLAVAALEEAAPLRRDRLGVLEVVLEQRPREPGVQPVDVFPAHSVLCSNPAVRTAGGP